MADRAECSGCPVLGSPLFEALPMAVRQRAICLFRPVELEAGTPLYLEGFPAHSVFAIRSGVCKSLRVAGNGREQVLRAFTPGEFVGLDAVALDQYPTTVIAATKTTVCHAPRTVFIDAAVGEPRFATAVIDYLCKELRTVREEQAALGTRGARARVARFLLAQHRRSADRGVELPLSHRDTAGLLGMVEESLSRQITALERLGVLRRRGRRLMIEDAARLEDLAGE